MPPIDDPRARRVPSSSSMGAAKGLAVVRVWFPPTVNYHTKLRSRCLKVEHPRAREGPLPVLSAPIHADLDEEYAMAAGVWPWA